MNLLFDWANTMLYCVVAILFFFRFLVIRPRFSKQVLLLTLLFFGSVQFVMEQLVNSYISNYQQMMILLVQWVLASLVVQFLFIGYWYKKFLFAILFTIFQSFTFETVSLVEKLVFEKSMGSFSISLLINLLILFVLRKVKKNAAETDSKLLTIEVIILLICSVASKIIVKEILHQLPSFPIKEVIMFCVSQIMLLLFYITFEMILSEHRKNQEHKLQEQRHQLMEQHYEKIENQQKEILGMREEMDHQLSTIDEYISEGNIDEAERIIDGYIEQIAYNTSYNFTSNSGINALLNSKFNQARVEGITCEFDIRLEEQMGIKDSDLTIVIGNILDNAIEACTYCESQKFIHFKTYQLNQTIAIFCENSTDGKVKSLRTRKSNSLKHGIGLKNVKETIEKYLGNMEISINERSFVIEGTMLDKGEE